MFTTRRVVVVDEKGGDAEILHMFFRLMEVECSLVQPDFDAVATIRRLHPNVVILDLDLPDLRALDIARALRGIPIILLTNREPELAPIDAPVMRKPGARFEELLRLFEMVLAIE
jgi:DNA-binding response OmpR family regulator